MTRFERDGQYLIDLSSDFLADSLVKRQDEEGNHFTALPAMESLLCLQHHMLQIRTKQLELLVKSFSDSLRSLSSREGEIENWGSAVKQCLVDAYETSYLFGQKNTTQAIIKFVSEIISGILFHQFENSTDHLNEFLDLSESQHSHKLSPMFILRKNVTEIIMEKVSPLAEQFTLSIFEEVSKYAKKLPSSPLSFYHPPRERIESNGSSGSFSCSCDEVECECFPQKKRFDPFPEDNECAPHSVAPAPQSHAALPAAQSGTPPTAHSRSTSHSHSNSHNSDGSQSASKSDSQSSSQSGSQSGSKTSQSTSQSESKSSQSTSQSGSQSGSHSAHHSKSASKSGSSSRSSQSASSSGE
eukprot:TRINITY_DN13917_c0_g1_i2.p1 TRINITY_DN13917_c0_g1~~TRINITY_DN13917_c0_g1_i2.p1  ORF type:complete len:382 (+),score=117.94 TRINITY_DN13917_c0_g1_i2:80-1147(+)